MRDSIAYRGPDHEMKTAARAFAPFQGDGARLVRRRAIVLSRYSVLHIYERGPHGVGLAPFDPVLSSWPRRLAPWMRLHGWMK